MNMQEMIYQKDRIPPVRLADGVYRGLPFYVLSLGTHPCAYVDIAPLGLNAINERDVEMKRPPQSWCYVEESA